MSESKEDQEEEISFEKGLEKLNIAEKDDTLNDLRLATIQDISSIAQKELTSKRKYLAHFSFGEKVKWYYERDSVNNLNILIVLCYLSFCVIRSQYYRNITNETWEIFYAVESGFTLLFGIDLLANMIAHCPGPFFRSYWNMTDLLIIPASFYLVFHEVSDWDCILALRTFKLFQKYAHRVEVSSLYIAFVNSIHASFVIIGVFILVICLYSIAGIEWFHDVVLEVDGEIEPYGEYYFGSQGVAMYSLLQVLTGDTWMTNITRRITNGERPISGPIFFISFTFVVSIIVMNLFASVFLDAFLSGKEEALDDHLRTMSFYIFTHLGGDPATGTVSREDLEILEIKLRKRGLKFDVDELFTKVGIEDEDVIGFDTFYDSYSAIEDREANLHKNKYDIMEVRLDEALEKIIILHEAQKHQTEKFENCHQVVFSTMEKLKNVAKAHEKEDKF